MPQLATRNTVTASTNTEEVSQCGEDSGNVPHIPDTIKQATPTHNIGRFKVHSFPRSNVGTFVSEEGLFPARAKNNHSSCQTSKITKTVQHKPHSNCFSPQLNFRSAISLFLKPITQKHNVYDPLNYFEGGTRAPGEYSSESLHRGLFC